MNLFRQNNGTFFYEFLTWLLFDIVARSARDEATVARSKAEASIRRSGIWGHAAAHLETFASLAAPKIPCANCGTETSLAETASHGGRCRACTAPDAPQREAHTVRPPARNPRAVILNLGSLLDSECDRMLAVARGDWPLLVQLLTEDERQELAHHLSEVRAA